MKRYSKLVRGAFKIGSAAAAGIRKRRRAASRGIKPKSRPSRRLRTAKRSRSGSRTVTKRKRNSESTTNAALFSAKYVSTGKRLKSSVYNNKLVSSNKSSLVSGFTHVSAWGGVLGAIGLKNTSTTISTGQLIAPLHIFDMTASINDNMGSIQVPQIGYELRFSDPTDAAVCQFVPLVPSTGGTMALERYDSKYDTITNQYPGTRDLLDYVSADMMFYCPVQNSTRVNVQFVQFKRDELCPEAAFTAGSGFATAFWQNYIKRYTYSPLSVLNAKSDKDITILKNINFYMDPKESTEPVNAITKRLKIFHRFNRLCNYNYNSEDKVKMYDDDMTINIAQNETQVVPKARIYMLIRAQARWNATYSSNLHPSYDISYRQKHSQLD